MSDNRKKKVLLIKLSSLGDVIFNVPLANALKDAGYEVTWLVSEKGIDIVKDNPCVDKTILVPMKEWKKRGMSLTSFFEYLDIIKQIRSEKFDIAIDSQMMFKSFYFMLFCGAKRRIISKEARELSILGGNEWIANISYKPDSQIVMNYLRYANHLGIEVAPEDVKVTLPKRTDAQIQKVNELLKDLDNSKQTVVISPATTWKNKHWNKDNWREVVNYLDGKVNLVFTGGPNESELINYVSQGKGLNIVGKTNIPELAEVFSRANLVISPDSGSAHLAWATRNPKVIAIFTCTTKEVIGPLGSYDKYISLGHRDFPCQPCFKRKCFYKEKFEACTFTPSVEEVIEAINSLIFA